MDIREQHLNRLKLAEQQFRLACTGHLAVANGLQTLDVPVEWTFGRHHKLQRLSPSVPLP
jgi:hypothetical protein